MFYPFQEHMEISAKSDMKAIEYRELGNKHFNSDNMYEALICYNKSITFANSNHVLSLGYANRSAVYLSLKCKYECLKNIEWARENKYPKDKLSKLDEREEKCKKLGDSGWKNVPENPWDFFKLSYPANEKIPWVVDCVEVRTTSNRGRGIYATKDMKAGDIISIEKPLSFLCNDGLYKHCMNCHKTNFLNLIPCAKTASMMFCSDSCMDDFYSKSIDLNMSLNKVMRLLIEVSASIGGYQEVDKFIDNIRSNEKKATIFDYDLSNPEDPNYKQNLANCICSLNVKETRLNSCDSQEIYKYVSKKTAVYLKALWRNSLSWLWKNDLEDLHSLGLFGSLINHSCLGNVNHLNVDGKIVTYLHCPVKAGEQLFHCYYGRIESDYKAKIKQINQYYDFKCDCKLCVNQSHRVENHKVDAYKLFMLADRNNIDMAKEFINQKCQLINASDEPENLSGDIYETLMVIKAMGSFATLPC